MTFEQPAYLRRPVIHLSINVGRIIRSPRRLNVPVPDALQIGRHITRSGTGYQQIASELVIELFQVVVRLSVPIVFQSLSSGQIGCFHCRIQFQFHSVEQRSVVFVVFVQ